jgi:hypothetical protein
MQRHGKNGSKLNDAANGGWTGGDRWYKNKTVKNVIGIYDLRSLQGCIIPAQKKIQSKTNEERESAKSVVVVAPTWVGPRKHLLGEGIGRKDEGILNTW